MKIIDNYIGKAVLTGIALVSLMLTGLQIFILFVNQLADLGRADYGIGRVAFFVLLQLPYQVYLFFPMACLLGCLMSLGLLANHSELIVMRAAGMSIGQITKAVLKSSMILIGVVTVLAEIIVPYLSNYANDYKWSALSGGQSLRTSAGIWLHTGTNFVLIGSIAPNLALQNVYQFHFDKNQDLQSVRYIQKVTYSQHQWTAHDISETEFSNQETRVRQLQSAPWDLPLKPNLLKLSHIEPEAMSLWELKQYLSEQRRNHQEAHRYSLSFLQRMVQPFTTLVMILLAIPFIFGPLRGSSMGSKFLVGASIGFGFYIANNLLAPFSLVFQWPPALAVFGPTLVFALLGLYLMRRVR